MESMNSAKEMWISMVGGGVGGGGGSDCGAATSVLNPTDSLSDLDRNNLATGSNDRNNFAARHRCPLEFNSAEIGRAHV
jgi:hypothetical protein